MSYSTSTESPSPTLSPLDRHGQIEVDVFCSGCFYNLHGQVVTVDPRLNIPVCQCPECGKFHPAGTGVTASSVWMRRLASILLFSWVMIVGGATFVFSLGTFLLGIASVESFTYGQSISISPHQYRYVQHLYSWKNAGDADKNINGIGTMLSISTGSLVVGFLAGVLCVTLLWHWQRPRYLWTLIVPLLPAGMLALIYHGLPNYDGIRLACVLHVLSQTGIQCVGILVGILIGRKVSRAIIRMVIPPKPRQALAFLWTVDHLPPG
jgi:hypothetical protein